MKFLQIVLFIALLVQNFVYSVEQEFQTFQVNIKYLGSQNSDWKLLGQLTIDQTIQYKKADLQLNDHAEQIINWENIDLTQKKFALLKFIDSSNTSNYYISHVDLTQQEKILSTATKKKRRNPLVNQEILELVTNIDDKVVAINYTVRKTLQSQFDYSIKTQFVESQEALELPFLFTSNMNQKPSGKDGKPGVAGGQGGSEEQVQQPTGILGFVKNYFWYIMIAIIVFMYLNNVDTEKLNEQVQQQQQSAQAARRRKH